MIGITLGLAADWRPIWAAPDRHGAALGQAVAVDDSLAGKCIPGKKGALGGSEREVSAVKISVV
ncbi:MAG: hypothetical protein ACO3B3_00785 [Cyanobium sp.]